MGTRIYTHIHTYNFRNHDEEYGNILNSLWLVAITFWCIGYGDIVPNTYCGRGICLIVGSSVRITFEGGHPNLRIRFDQKSGAAIIMKSDNRQCNTLGRWDKRLIDHASDVPSIIFFIISYTLRALKTLYFYFCKFIKKKKN